MALGELKNGIGPDAYAIYQQVLAAVVERDHQVGSLYISENPTSPAELYGGTWERVEDCTIWGASDTHPAGTKLEAGLPILYGQINGVVFDGSKPVIQGTLKNTVVLSYLGALASSGTYELYSTNLAFSANIGIADTVQPPAYCMYIWRRVA